MQLTDVSSEHGLDLFLLELPLNYQLVITIHRSTAVVKQHKVIAECYRLSEEGGHDVMS